MASGYNLGRAFITITPVMQGAVKDISRSLDGAGLSAGKSFSNALSRGIGSSKVDTTAVQAQLDKAKSAAERAGTAMEDADRKVTKSAGDMSRARKDAADRIAIAETRVAEVREKSIAKDRAVVSAEKELTAARKAGDPDAVAAAEKRLGAARDGASVTSSDLSAEKQLSDAREKYGKVSREGITTLGKWKAEQASARAEVERTTGDLKQAEAATEQTGNAFTRLGSKLKNALPSSFSGAFKSLEGDSTKSAKNVENDFERAGRESSSSFRESFKGAFAGVATTVGVYFGADQILDGFKSSIKGAADLEQSVGGVQTVFQGSSKQMLAWSKQANQSLGLTSNEYNEFSARLGASLKNAGTPMDQLGDKTNGLITMGADLASLYGGTTAEAVDALSAALRGEMDPIERYGISLNDAALTQEGLALGIQKTGGSFTNQQKQLITMSLLQKQSADATGNFARESDTASNIAQRLTAKLKDMATGLGQKLLPILSAVGGWIIDKGLPALESFGDSIGNVFDLMVTGDFKGGIFGLAEDSKPIDVLLDVRDAALYVWKNALKPLVDWLASNRGAIGDFAMGIVDGIGTAISSVASIVQWVVANQNWILPLAAGIGAVVLAWKAWTTAIIIWQGITKIAAGVQLALNAVMAANPIGIIVLAIIGLVAALVVAYKKSEWFRGVVDAVWGGIKTAIGAVADWIVTYVWPVIKAAWEGIAAGAVWLWQNVLVPAWQGIWGAIQFVADWIVNTLVPWLQSAWTAIAAAAVWLWQNVISPVWEGIKVAIAIAVAIIMTYIDLLVWYWQNVIAPVAMWLWNNVIQPVWNGIQTAIGVAVDIIMGIVNGLVWLWQNVLAPAALWLYSNVIQPVWNGIQAAIKFVVDAVTFYINGWIWLFQNVLAPAFQWLYDKIIKPVWDGIQTAIRVVVDWFQNTAWPAISYVIELMKTGFGVMKDKIGDAWAWVKDKIIEPVVSWFRDTVGPLFDTVTGGISNAFDVMKDAVGKAWTALQDAAKAPIKFVVETIVRDGIVKNFNKIADKFGVGTIDEKQFTVGFASGGVLPGYTPGRDVHDFYSPSLGRLRLSGGEAIMRPEWTRAVGGPAAVETMNRRARRGQAFASGGVFTGGGAAPAHAYKLGGVLDWLAEKGGDVYEWTKDAAGFAADALGDPLGAFKKLLGGFVDGIPGGGLMLDLAKGVPTKIVDTIGTALSNSLNVISGGDAGGGTVSGPMPSGPKAAALSLAQTKLGARYVWGAAGPNVFDCSGLVQWAYQNAFGSRLPRTANAQYAASKKISQAQAGPGDIVHWPGHIGLYEGGGRVTHASHSQWRVLRSGLWGNPGFGRFAEGGVVPTLFDTGGLLQPGQTTVLNKTGQAETVLTAPQWRDVSQAVSYVTNEGGGSEMTVMVENRPGEDPTTTGRRIGEAAQMARMVGVGG